MATIKYFQKLGKSKVRGPVKYSPIALKRSADVDFLTFILVWLFRIAGNSGSTWLSVHSIEKYLKCLILKKNSLYDVKKANHNLLLLWQDCKIYYKSADCFKDALMDNFIIQLNQIDINVRYSLNGCAIYPEGFYMYVLLATHLRFLYLGKKGYEKIKNYGLGRFDYKYLLVNSPYNSDTENYIIRYLDKILREKLIIDANGEEFNADYMQVSKVPSYLIY